MPQKGPQSLAIAAGSPKDCIDELLFGGAVGGGKSDFLLGDFAQDIPEPWGPHCNGILFRKTYGELEELIARSQEMYPPWFGGQCEWKDSTKTWTFWNGATLKLRYLENSKDWMRYWGHQYTWIGWDELPNWADLTPYHKMKARLRSAHNVPNKRIRASGNPGGPGHNGVKTYFGIDRHPHGSVIFTDPETNTRRVFIRSRVQDNKILMHNDPGYVSRLKGLGSEVLVRAWLEGDWGVVVGAYFDCWSNDKHVIRPFEIPQHWVRFRSGDWGSARPFSFGWWAVASEAYETDAGVIPVGALVRYREWYGASEPNVGLKLTAEEVGAGLAQRESEREDVSYGVLDPAAFAQDGGPSIAERIYEGSGNKIVFTRADNKRVPRGKAPGGWDAMRARLVGEDDRPMIYVFDTCVDSIRTIPSLQHDEVNPEDLDTEGEDHAADEWRYACMSRPYTQPKPTKPEDPLKPLQEMTYQELEAMTPDHTDGGRI